VVTAPKHVETEKIRQSASRRFQIASLLVMGAVLTVLAAAPVSHAQETIDMSPGIATLIDAHNRVREQHELGPLQPHPQLMAAARTHARYMAEREKTAHRGRGGSMPAQRVKRQGYVYVTVAENVASGQSSPEEVLASWMHSPPHRQNILGDFAEIGAARVVGDDQRPYWCVVFATPMPDLEPQQASATLVTLLNQKRQEANLAPLQVAPQLATVAAAQARDMAAHNTLQPRQGNGADLSERLAQSGYPYAHVSQAAASGSPTPAAVVQYLMDSAPYRERVLGTYSDVGAGYATAANGTPYWSLIFGVPRR
jgi:uncharacterized protein YkwD